MMDVKRNITDTKPINHVIKKIADASANDIFTLTTISPNKI